MKLIFSATRYPKLDSAGRKARMIKARARLSGGAYPLASTIEPQRVTHHALAKATGRPPRLGSLLALAASRIGGRCA